MKRIISMLLVLIVLFTLGCMAIPAAASGSYTAGDMNGDGNVNVIDALRLFRYVNSQITSLDDGADGDITGDGRINIADALKLFRYVNRQIDSLGEAVPPQQTEQNDYAIVDIEVADGQANILLSTIDSCLLTIRFISEDDTTTVADDVVKVVGSGLQLQTISAALPSGLPDSYKIVAYLCDENGNYLCDSFSSIHETSDYKDFMEKTPEDFTDDTVINFDDDPDDNFGVLADGIVYCEASSIHTNMSGYMVVGLDDALLNLQPGDTAYIAASNGQAVAVNVASLQYHGNMVIIGVDDQLGLSDIYQYLQIDMNFDDMSGATVTPMDGVTYSILDAGSDSIDLQTNAFGDAAMEDPQADGFSMAPVDTSCSDSLSLSAPTVYLWGDADSTYNVALNLGVDFTYSIEFHACYDIKLFGADYFEMSYTATKSGSVSATISASAQYGDSLWDNSDDSEPVKEEDKSIDLADVDVPLGATGLTAGFEISVPYSLELEAGLTVQYSWEQSETVSYSTDDGESSSKSKDSAINVFTPEGSITASIGIELSLNLALLKDVVKLSAYADITLSATAELATDIGLAATDADSIHTCAVCLNLSVDVTFEVGVRVDVCVIKSIIEGTVADLNLFSITWTVFTGYCSVSHGFEFGTGDCPYQEYRVTVKLKDADGNFVGGHDFTVSGGSSVSGRTGNAIYLTGGQNYTFRLTYNGQTYTKTIKDLSDAQTVIFTISTAAPTPTVTATPAATATPVPTVEPGSVTYTADVNGHHYEIYSTGLTWDQAEAYCESVGGHLMTVTSEEEQTILEQLLKNGDRNSYWLGGQTNGTSTVVWITGEECTYTHWASFQPDNYLRQESKLMVYRKKNTLNSDVNRWNDLNGDGTCNGETFFGLENFGFICEWDDAAGFDGSADTDTQIAPETVPVPTAEPASAPEQTAVPTPTVTPTPVPTAVPTPTETPVPVDDVVYEEEQTAEDAADDGGAAEIDTEAAEEPVV